ncbi:MAG: metallophosphoesterase [Bacilli bacterium]|nr:metallophosphoesterase [Bacilli bacterium]
MYIFKRVIRIVSYVVLTFCLVGLIFCAVSSDKLDIVSYEFKTSKNIDTFTCLVISDYHHRSLNFSNGNMIDILKEQNPVDYIFYTGDLIDSYTNSLDDINEIFKAGNSISKHSYFVTGNHEEYAPNWQGLQDKMHEEGVTYIKDDHIDINEHFHIYGLEDARFKTRGGASFKSREEATLASLDEMTKAFNKDDFNILLSHRPENFKKIADNYNFDLVVSGHTHGGQFKIGNWTPSSIALEEGEYMGGIYHRNSTDLVISRGLGYSAMFPLRVNCNPEIVKITISK